MIIVLCKIMSRYHKYDFDNKNFIYIMTLVNGFLFSDPEGNDEVVDDMVQLTDDEASPTDLANDANTELNDEGKLI